MSFMINMYDSELDLLISSWQNPNSPESDCIIHTLRKNRNNKHSG